MQIDPFVAAMPKAELHVHIEGTIGPAQRAALARRNGLPCPDEKELAASFDYAGLEEFLRVYYEGVRTLATERDFYETARAFLDRCGDENVIHVEISFDPQPHIERGVPIEAVMGGLLAACREAGVSTRLVMCVNRDRPLDEAMPLFDLVRPWREQIAGVGLDSAERGNPPVKFAAFYDRARTEGYQLTAHCDVDQENSVEHIRQCLDALKVDRIDHGVNALEDPALVERIRDSGTCLTVCPTWRPSDPAPRRLDRLRRLFDLGVRVTVNTDDPGLFASGYMNRTLSAVRSAGGYSKSETIALMRNAFLGCWAEPDEKAAMLERLSAYAASSV